MGGKKWCEYCRINLPYDKKAIDEHEKTRLHEQNKAKHIKFERIKIQREEKIKRQSLKADSLMSTANIPKAKKGSQLEKEVSDYRQDVITSGKMAIHQLIAERTKGMFGAPIQYPEKEDLVLAENYIEEKDSEEGEPQEEKFQMWKIDICEDTGKACFINRISQAKVYEPPKGYIMSEEQKEEWEETKKICEEAPEENHDEVGQVGQWEEVEEEEDYFQQNEASPNEQQVQEPQIKESVNQSLNQPQLEKQVIKSENPNKIVAQVDKPKDWMDDLQEKIQKNQLSQSQVISTVLSNTLSQCRSIKQKNEALKKLVKNDFQIRATLDQNDREWLKEEQGDAKKSIGIKPRKKVKTCQLVDDSDIV